jgi:hypothetical protein
LLCRTAPQQLGKRHLKVVVGQQAGWMVKALTARLAVRGQFLDSIGTQETFQRLFPIRLPK